MMGGCATAEGVPHILSALIMMGSCAAAGRATHLERTHHDGRLAQGGSTLCDSVPEPGAPHHRQQQIARDKRPRPEAHQHRVHLCA